MYKGKSDSKEYQDKCQSRRNMIPKHHNKQSYTYAYCSAFEHILSEPHFPAPPSTRSYRILKVCQSNCTFCRHTRDPRHPFSRNSISIPHGPETVYSIQLKESHCHLFCCVQLCASNTITMHQSQFLYRLEYCIVPRTNLIALAGGLRGGWALDSVAARGSQVQAVIGKPETAEVCMVA